MRTATITVPAPGRYEHRETVVDVDVTGSSTIMVAIGAHADTDENEPDLLSVLSLAAVPGSGSFDVLITFSERHSGPINLLYTV